MRVNGPIELESCLRRGQAKIARMSIPLQRGAIFENRSQEVSKKGSERGSKKGSKIGHNRVPKVSFFLDETPDRGNLS